MPGLWVALERGTGGMPGLWEALERGVGGMPRLWEAWLAVGLGRVFPALPSAADPTVKE